MMKRALRGLAAILMLAIVMLAGGWTYQRLAERRDDRLYPPPGRLYPVNGRLMHIHCRGTGNPAIIVEQGIGGPSIDWNDINDQMSRITRVCDYDRAGMGYSEPAFIPTRSTDVARNLHTLLGAAGIDDDIVFVAWSAGGLYAKEYFRQFPAHVKGMVLVDSTHEQMRQRMPTPPSNQGNYDRLMRQYVLAQFGWLRLKGEIAEQYAAAPLPEPDRQRLIAFFLKSHTYRTLVDEGVGLDQDMALNSPLPNLGDMPLVVIAQGKPRNPYMQKNLAQWHELQRELAGLSTNGRLAIAGNSAHDIHHTEPELIVNAAHEVVSAVRAARR